MALTQLSLFPDSRPALDSYDWIVVNSSSGKDSLVMLSVIAKEATDAGALGRVVVAHADIGRVEWPGTRDLAERQADRFGVPFLAVWRQQGDLLQQIHHYSLTDIWAYIESEDLGDLVHYAYALGMPRLSCCFCTFSPRSALRLAGKHNPDTFRQDLSLASVQSEVLAGAEAGPVQDWSM